MKPALPQLLHNPLVWRGDQLARVEQVVSSGFHDLDLALPGGGWPQTALTELLRDEEGIGELRLLLPALKRLAQAGQWVVLIAPPHLPYAPAFAAAGIDPARVMVVGATEDRHRWWSAEQVLRARSAAALLFWPAALGEQRLRRLQLAAQEGRTLAFVFATTARAAQPSPAPLRIRLSPAGARLRVEIFKRRGGTMSAPLLLDVATATGNGMGIGRDDRPCTPAMNHRGLSPVRASFHRRYPVGGPQTRIWNRALARADEVRRVPGPDPRGHT
jgi:cell division inhibitor SulA